MSCDLMVDPFASANTAAETRKAELVSELALEKINTPIRSLIKTKTASAQITSHYNSGRQR